MLLLIFLNSPMNVAQRLFFSRFCIRQEDGILIKLCFYFQILNSTEKKPCLRDPAVKEHWGKTCVYVCVLWVRYKDREKERRDGYSSVQTQGMLRPNLNTSRPFQKHSQDFFGCLSMPCSSLPKKSCKPWPMLRCLVGWYFIFFIGRLRLYLFLSL